jgi:hypothetical protein
VFAARGAHAAYAGRRGVVRRRDDGTWEARAWEGRVTALAFIDDRGTLVASTYSEVDDTTALVRLDASPSDAPTVVARIGPAPLVEAISDAARGTRDERDDGDRDEGGRVLALAYDDARGVVWVAGGFGVAAYAVR